MFASEEPPPQLLTADEFEAAVAPTLRVPFKSVFRGGFVAELMGEKPERDWLLKNALTARTLLFVVGEPGCGKSFLLLDMAMNMALAAVDKKHPKVWFGRRIKPGGIVYIAGEGQDDFIIRMHAWKVGRGLAALDIPIYLIPVAVDMRTSDERTTALIAEVKDREEHCRERFGVGFELLVIDTVNKALAGGNDSKPEDVGPFLRNCFRLRDDLRVAIAAVHHLPKNGGSQDPRGAGSLKGDNDVQWFVAPAKGGAPNYWTIARSKAGPTGARHEFRLRQVEVAKDEDGDPITSCVVVPLASEESPEEAEMRAAADAVSERRPTMTADGRMILGDKPTAVLRALQLASDTDGDPLPVGKDADGADRPINIPHGRKAIKMARWTDEIVKIWPGDNKETPQFKDARRKDRDTFSLKLAERGYIVIDGEWAWRSARRVAGVDRAEIPKQEPEIPSGAIGREF